MATHRTTRPVAVDTCISHTLPSWRHIRLQRLPPAYRACLAARLYRPEPFLPAYLCLQPGYRLTMPGPGLVLLLQAGGGGGTEQAGRPVQPYPRWTGRYQLPIPITNYPSTFRPRLPMPHLLPLSLPIYTCTLPVDALRPPSAPWTRMLSHLDCTARPFVTTHHTTCRCCRMYTGTLHLFVVRGLHTPLQNTPACLRPHLEHRLCHRAFMPPRLWDGLAAWPATLHLCVIVTLLQHTHHMPIHLPLTYLTYLSAHTALPLHTRICAFHCLHATLYAHIQRCMPCRFFKDFYNQACCSPWPLPCVYGTGADSGGGSVPFTCLPDLADLLQTCAYPPASLPPPLFACLCYS